MSNTEKEHKNIPEHVAVIMDGNGRWAKERGQDRVYGHHAGVLSVREVVNTAGAIGVKYLTLYAFSTENWNRPKAEVDALMELLVATIRKEVDELHKNNVRVHVIGDFDALPPVCQKEMQEAMDMTAANTGLNLILALSYSAKWEILRATRQIAEAVKNGSLSADEITDEVFHSHLCTSRFPDPELMIRTSGETRISNFLLYQLAYAELYFTPTLWPDFGKDQFLAAISDYQNRERRFGMTSEQIQPSK
ncbi:isoprenyl transferase [Rurimicrobium arvi]|uniref:Isoprenyl transferase n=1 Tax=Rurimicrobium arvi TaxID=2049916 RepID=A0ABP8MS36_9BACT